MLQIRLSKQANKFLDKIPAKHAQQIVRRIMLLAENNGSIASIELKGYAPWKRAKSGEYRIIFRVEDKLLHIGLLGKRNDDDIYRLIERFLR